MRRILVLAVITAAFPLMVPDTGLAGARHLIGPPVASGSLHIGGPMRDGGTVTAAGVAWRPGRLPHGDRLLSFEVAYVWSSCPASGGRCTLAAGTGAAPFAARRYVVAHADTGRRLKLVVTATEVVETDPATFSFRVLRTSRSATTAGTVAAYRRGRRSEEHTSEPQSP